MRKVGIWMYQNGGGDVIQNKIVNALTERGIACITGLDLRFAHATSEGIFCQGTNMLELDAFFSYNAGEQTVAQVCMYETLSSMIPTINNFEAFRLTEDKFRTNLVLNAAGVRTSDFLICHREQTEKISEKFDEWGKIVFKPIDGWGGAGMALLENRLMFDAMKPFLNQLDIRHIYVERFINYDYSDFRIDVVDGEYIGCYGRKAGSHDWRTNITSGGSVIMREPNDELIEIAEKAAKAVKLEIAGVDIIYDLDHQEYVVLEINGIPAFATPDQEAMGLDFNDHKIAKIVEMIDRVTQK